MGVPTCQYPQGRAVASDVAGRSWDPVTG
jgi:hypothetical protein